jgi:hypothetical protein
MRGFCFNLISPAQDPVLDEIARLFPRGNRRDVRREPDQTLLGSAPMQDYPIDIEPAQIVRWIIVERQAAPSKFKIVARRALEARELATKKELRLGDEERDDLSETATMATLQIAPSHPSDGWLLTVTIDDEIGPPMPEGIAMGNEEQEIDVDEFYDEFLRPGRGNANAVAEVMDAAAKARLSRLLEDVETNRHGQDRGE